MKLPSWLGLVAVPLAFVLAAISHDPSYYAVPELVSRYLALALGVLTLVVWHVPPPGIALPSGVSALLAGRAPPAPAADGQVGGPETHV